MLGIVLWVRSYSASIWWPPALQKTSAQLHIWRGRVYLVCWHSQNVPPAVFMEIHFHDGPKENFHPVDGFNDAFMDYAGRHEGRASSVQTAFMVGPPSFSNGYGFAGETVSRGWGRLLMFGAPFWFIELIATVPCAMELRRSWRAREEDRKGVCAGCGYDLRATRDRCPECGASVSVPG